jgi:predicted SprT family Zn-dependent metalloprotease
MTTTLEERRNRYEWIYKETAEMSAILGIKTPKIKIVGIDADSREEIGGYYYKDGVGGKHRHYYAGTAYINEHKIIIKPKRSPFASIRVGSTRTTIAHELIHLKYWKLRHGKEFDKRMKELVEKWKQKKKKKSRETIRNK